MKIGCTIDQRQILHDITQGSKIKAACLRFEFICAELVDWRFIHFKKQKYNNKFYTTSPVKFAGLGVGAVPCLRSWRCFTSKTNYYL